MRASGERSRQARTTVFYSMCRPSVHNPFSLGEVLTLYPCRRRVELRVSEVATANGHRYNQLRRGLCRPRLTNAQFPRPIPYILIRGRRFPYRRAGCVVTFTKQVSDPQTVLYRGNSLRKRGTRIQALGWKALGWKALCWRALGWKALGWGALGWGALGWKTLGWKALGWK